jgi:hypothetical protein
MHPPKKHTRWYSRYLTGSFSNTSYVPDSRLSANGCGSGTSKSKSSLGARLVSTVAPMQTNNRRNRAHCVQVAYQSKTSILWC